jgi:hypothetical protein
MKHAIPLVLLIILMKVTHGYGQCCNAGNPSSFSFGDQVSLKARNIQASTAYKYGYSRKYFSGNKPIDLGFSAPASFSFMNIAAAFGISSKFTLLADAGYFFNKKQENPEPFPADRGYGLGDATFNLRYRIIKSMKHQMELIVHAGVRLPAGVFDQEKEGVKLPITVQPSSGSFVYLGGIDIAKSLKDSKWKFYSSLSMEFPQWIDSKNFYYRYGNLYNISIASAYLISRKLLPSIQLQAEFRNHAKREENAQVDASGYKILFFTPMFETELFKQFSMQVYADFPIYRYFEGIQLSNSYRTGIKLIKRFTI